MIVINNIDSQRFTFNGVEYYKNFTPIVIGDKIRVLNAYDSTIELTDSPRLFSEFEVNGLTYASVSLLQSALLPILYTRNTLGGGGGGDLQQTTDLGNTTTNPIETGNITVTENQGGDPPIKIIQDITDTDTFVAVEESSSSFNYNFKIKPLTASRVIYVEDDSGSIATREWVTANAGGSSVITEINTTGTASSGTAETITYSVLIPANTMSVGVYDAITRVTKVGTAGSVTINMYVNDTNDLTTPILIGRSISTSTARYMPLQKFINIKVLDGTGLGTEVANNVSSASFPNDYIQHGNISISNEAINWTIDQYLIVTVTNSNAGDSSTGTFLILKK